MQIERVQIRGLHGALNLDVRLSTGINLLVGINGSGKTSLLNLIDWLLRPNLMALATTRFELAELTLALEGGKAITIRAVQSNTDLDVFYEEQGVPIGQPFNVKLVQQVDGTESKQRIDELVERYSGLGPEKHELSTWNAIAGIPKPIVITLDRRITVEEATGSTYVDVDLRTRAPRRQPPRSTLDWVLDTARAAWAHYKTHLLGINDHLKNEVMLSSFEGKFKGGMYGTKLPTLAELELVESRLLAQVSSWNKDPVAREKISAHFQWLRDVVTELAGPDVSLKDVVLNLYRGEIHRVDALSAAFRKFEEASAAAYEPIKNYLDAVNWFLKDSRKAIVFDERRNGLAFQYDLSGEDQLRPVHNLSSGERQILILLTFMAFPPNNSYVFIVDEPELSLHPKWQHDFLLRLEPLLKQRSQLIVATHSPEIAGKYRDRCISLDAPL